MLITEDTIWIELCTLKLGVVYHYCLTDSQVLHCQGKDSLALTAMLGKSSIMSWICE